MKGNRINDYERRLWVLNDEGLYRLQQKSRQSMRKFIKENRQTIDEVITGVTSGQKNAHYLVYG